MPPLRGRPPSQNRGAVLKDDSRFSSKVKT